LVGGAGPRTADGERQAYAVADSGPDPALICATKIVHPGLEVGLAGVESASARITGYVDPLMRKSGVNGKVSESSGAIGAIQGFSRDTRTDTNVRHVSPTHGNRHPDAIRDDAGS
jgi:hypothetical protein